MPQSIISRLWWFALPVLLLLIQIAIELFVSPALKEVLLQEGGPHETLQAAIMAVAFILGSILFFRVKNGWLKIWFGIAALASLYVTGEELSWGQWIFHWQTPAEWEALNDQGETNLHNTSSWLDQKPMILLQIGVLVGGIIIPLLKRFKPSALPARFAPIYGDYHLLPTSLIALAIKLFDTAQDHLGFNFFWRISEVQELYMFYFVALYLFLMMKSKYPAASSDQ